MCKKEFNVRDLNSYELLYEESYLRNLALKLARDKVLTLGQLCDVGEDELRKKYGTSDGNVARVKNIVSDFGLHLN